MKRLRAAVRDDILHQIEQTKIELFFVDLYVTAIKLRWARIQEGLKRASAK